MRLLKVLLGIVVIVVAVAGGAIFALVLAMAVAGVLVARALARRVGILSAPSKRPAAATAAPSDVIEVTATEVPEEVSRNK